MHPLAAKLVDLQRRLVLRERATAMCAIVAATLAAAGVLGLVDFVVRVSDRGLRLMMTATLAAAALYAVYRWWYGSRARRRVGPLAVARRVEAQFPQLDDRLASAMEFLGQTEDDATAGSATLRRAVVIGAEHAIGELPLDAVIDRQPLRRAATCAGVAVAAVALSALVAGVDVRTAAVRLLAPLGATEWPRANHLEFRQAPQRIAVGQPFEVELVDAGGALPDEVQIQYRVRGEGGSKIQTEPMNRVDDTMVARRNDVRGSFEYRAEGGDDRTMAWTKVEVVEPPRLSSLAIVTHPPAYTGLPAAAAERHLEALAGTGIEVIGMADQSLGAARIVAGDKTIPAKLVADSAGHERRGFVIPADDWIAATSGKYRLELESVDGVAGTVAEGNLQVVPDTPPTVSWERPRDDLMVLSTATVPIEVSVKDNLAIASVELGYSRSDQADAKLPAIEMYRGPESVAPAGAVAAQQHGESRGVEFDWSLVPLTLPEGTQLAANVAASDYRPGTGQTATPRRITVVSREQLEARLAGEQAQIARRLAEALKLQQATRDDVHGLEIQLRDAGQLAAADRDTLSAAEANQRRVGRSLVAPADGVAAQAETVLAELAMNGIADGDLPRPMADLKQGLAGLAAEALPTAERELSSARKTAESSKDSPALSKSLAAADGNQEESIAALQQMLSEMAGAADFGQLARDLEQLRVDQLAHQKVTRDAVGIESLPLELRELSRQQRATLNKAADGEGALARRYERIEQTISRLAGELKDRDAATAERLGDAAELAKLLGIDSMMQEVGQDLSGNRVGQALEGESRVADGLQELIDNLRERSQLRPEELVSKLRAAEKELAAVRGELAKLRAQLAQAEQQAGGASQNSAEQLHEQQKQLQSKIGQLARQMRRLQASAAGKTAGQAAEKLGQSGEQTAKSSDAQEAEKNLADAARQLAARRAQAEEDLFRQFMQRFQIALQTMIEDQQKVIAGTAELKDRLQKERPGRETLKAEQSAIAALASKEHELAAAVSDHRELLAGLHVIGLALGEAAAQLDEAAGQLDRQQTGAATQQTEQRALERLEQIAAALEQAKQASGGQQSNSPAGNSGGSSQPKRPTIELFEAKLLRSLQADLGERTQALRQRMAAPATANGENRVANGREADDLAAEQGHLAELVRELASRDNGNGDNDDRAK